MTMPNSTAEIIYSSCGVFACFFAEFFVAIAVNIENRVLNDNSPSPSMDAPSTAVGLDGEEIETVCELKGQAIQLTYS
jgi:hypothetical protein